jgi:hypothetical protein
MAFANASWAQTAATEPRVFQRVEDFYESAELAWKYRDQIQATFVERTDLVLQMDHDVEWIKANYFQQGMVPTSPKQARRMEKTREKAQTPAQMMKVFKDYIAKVERAKVLLAKLRDYDSRDPNQFHAAYRELVEIGRSHISFGFEQVIGWQMRRIFPSCEIPLKQAGLVEYSEEKGN